MNEYNILLTLQEVWEQSDQSNLTQAERRAIDEYIERLIQECD